MSRRSVAFTGRTKSTAQTQLNTEADITLLSVVGYTKINRPKLVTPFVKLKSADNKDIKVRGYFQCNFSIDGRKGRGNYHDADTQSQHRLHWMAQNKPLFRCVTEDTTNIPLSLRT
ncbi:unnamed protein product [Toxocara canis]|uniref:Peptidase A2 domain-containing protein n=1 Tax=Toxocara canis TaxID=6265 RepID=A0A183U062_TOXCA|nr:unnamed protein product [Toxocara canis]